MIRNQLEEIKKSEEYETKTNSVFNTDLIRKSDSYFEYNFPKIFQLLVNYGLEKELDGETVYISDDSKINLPKIFKDKEYMNSWKKKNTDYLEFYTKQPDFLVNHILYSGNKVNVYECINKKNNQFYVFK